MFSAQERHFNKDKFKSQMYKIHRPHLHSGYLKKASYESTIDPDGKPDWILYYTPGAKAKKEYRTFNPERRLKQGTPDESDDVLNDEEASRAQSAPSQAEDLVRHFYQLFHNSGQSYPRAKELTEAKKLIAQHGFERAMHIVAYSHRKAGETRYQPQTFQGILHYAGPALASYEEEQSRKQEQAAIDACALCDHGGWISFIDSARMTFTLKCPHDSQKIEDYEQQTGVKRN